jgi:ABC-type siderophore export system fused ATPase/permease subunit
LIQSVAKKLKSMSAAVMMERMAIKVLDEWAAAGYPVPDRDFSTEESMRVANL